MNIKFYYFPSKNLILEVFFLLIQSQILQFQLIIIQNVNFSLSLKLDKLLMRPQSFKQW